jgi:hypothetical protein
VITFRGIQLFPAIDSIVNLLEQPAPAAVLGLALGVGLLFLSRKGFQGVTPEDPFRGLLVAAMAMFGRLLASVLLLWVYKAVAPDGFAPFAITFAVGFLVTYSVELVRFAGLHRYARPVRTRG